MTASTSNAQSSALFNLSNLSERLRGAAQAAAGEKGFKAGLKEALAKSPFLALSYFVLSVPFEIMINKTIKPTISKLYKKFKRDENAEPPEIAQSLFSALRTFVWFPAVFVGDFLYHIVNGNTTNPQNSSINQNSAPASNSGTTKETNLNQDLRREKNQKDDYADSAFSLSSETAEIKIEALSR